MLSSLYIKNYALIDVLHVDFNTGLSIITGETGAGKSILLGGLALVLGKRADISQVNNKEEKCIIEATFNIAEYELKTVFNTLDLDYDDVTIIRREILPSGKSRAFINDTPTTIDALSKLSYYLIDVHSQQQTQQLTDTVFQFQVIDALANNQKHLLEYSKLLKHYKHQQKALDALQRSKADLIKEYDYNLFLLKELEDIQLEHTNLEDLETEHENLNNVEVITETLAYAKNAISAESIGVSEQLQHIKTELGKIANYASTYTNIWERINSIHIELDDIFDDITSAEDNLLADPQRLILVNNTLQTLNNLFQKHNVSTVSELKAIQAQLTLKIDDTQRLDADIETLEKELQNIKITLQNRADIITKNRQAAAPKLSTQLENILQHLGMSNAKFNIEIIQKQDFLANGKDHLNFMFMANKGSSFNTLKKAASGGEMSRITLAVKSILASYVKLPTIMFDEIDTGVSGEISNKMGDIMKQMSANMQVFAITHLPQVAAKGDYHFKVFKNDINQKTQTQLQQLSTEQRVSEIAQMLDGSNASKTAITHAKQLLAH